MLLNFAVTVSTLKVNYTPYLLDIVFSNEIDSLKHKASVKDGVLNITLFKKVPGQWESLEVIGDKKTLNAIKAESMQLQSKINDELTAKRNEKKIDDERHAVRKQMALDEMERNKLENLKLEEKQEAEKSVYEAFARMNYEETKKTTKKERSVTFAPAVESKALKKEPEVAVVPPTNSSKSIFDEIDQLLDEDDIDDPDKVNKIVENVQSKESIQVSNSEEDAEEEVYFIPPPRSSNLSSASDAKVNIKFTPRLFPTPMRESKASEEEDWIAKNRRHLKKNGILAKGGSTGGDFSEEDPVWLKAKGDDFFRFSCFKNRSVLFIF